MKIGQLLSTRLSQLPTGFAVRLGRLQDRVDPGGLRFTLPDIERELGPEAASRFRRIQSAPIASGSAAVVFRGELTDGRAVAIKVVRSDGFETTRIAINAIRAIASMVAHFNGLSRIPLLEAIDDVGAAMLRQFDLEREARLTQRMREVFAGEPRIRVPHVLTELSNARLLTMEYLDGLEKLTIDSDGPALEDSLRLGFQALFKMILEHGVVHCDFHAGNVFFSRHGVVTILDMGFMEELTAVETHQFREFFIGIMLGDGRRCVRVLLETAVTIDDACDKASLERHVRALVESRSRASADAFRVVAFVAELFRIQCQHGIRGSHRFTMTILSLLVYEGIAAKLVPTIDFQKEALPVVGPILVRRGF